MIQLDFGALVLAFIAAMGVPSAIMGLIVWALKKRIDAREKDQDEKNRAQQKLCAPRPEHQGLYCPG